MTYAELLAQAQTKQQRKPQRHIEHDTQVACVRWFRLQYPHLALLLFAVPNGTNKSKAARISFMAEGLTSGVADLLLLVPRGEYHGLCIEMKSRTGRQSESQKAWQEIVEKQGYRYTLCRCFDDFKREIDYYLRL